MTAAGFKKYVRPGITVQVAETARIDATLQIGAASDTVTVNAEAPLLKTESGELSHQIDYNAADELPVVQPERERQRGHRQHSGPAVGVEHYCRARNSLPILRFASTACLPVRKPFAWKARTPPTAVQQTGNQAVQQGVDAIQEVSIQTSNFAAEYGQVGGGYINYTMKSGTNQFHGSAYDYFQNEALNAGLPFTINTARHRARQEPLAPQRLWVHFRRTGQNSETVQR